MIDNSKFTPWAKEIFEMYDSRVCNTFIVEGNVGDYAFGFYNLTDYLSRLCQAVECFNMDAVIVYDSNQGGTYQFIRKGNASNCKPISFTEMCNKIEKGTGDEKIAYIIKYPQGCIPTGSLHQLRSDHESNCIMLHRAITSNKFFRQQSMLIIIAESANDVNEMFISSNVKSMTIKIPLPSAEERKVFIEASMDLAKRRRVRGFGCTISLDTLTRLTAGLTRLSIEDLILHATNDNPLTHSTVLKKKEELIEREYGHIIEILDPSNLSLDDFAGQDKIKSYFQDVVIDAIAHDRISIIPKGVLLMGPPGTGKSYFARCLAGSAGINFVEFKMSKILDKYVGEAEKNLEKAFAVFRALAPVGVFIDELDQVLSRGDNDTNSVNRNLFGMFLAELSKPENRGKIIWLGATNYPNKIDEALKRTGRFDKKIPFFAPTEKERELVFQKRICKTSPASVNINYVDLAKRTNGFTQAEIEGVVVKALELAIRKGVNVIRSQDLDNALTYMYSAQNAKIVEMENIALLECNDVEFLPDAYVKRRAELMNV